MKKSITKNYMYNLIYQMLTLITPLITAPYISRVLGAENIGIFSYTTSVEAYFVLLGSIGIALYAQRETAYLQDKPKEYSKLFWEINIIRLITMSISIIIFYEIFAKAGEYHVFYTILLLDLCASCFDISWFFQGMEDFKRTVTRNIIVKILSIAGIFAFVKTQNDLVMHFWLTTSATVFGHLSLWPYLTKYLKKVKFKELNIKRHIKPVLVLFIPQIATKVYLILDKVMLGIIIPNKSEVGYYEQSEKIVKMLLTIVTLLGTVMLPRMAKTYIDGDKEKLHEYLKKSFSYMFLLAFPMIFGVFLISEKFVPIFFGPGYEKVAILMCIISPILLMIGISNVVGAQYLLPTKQQRKYTISVIVGAIVNVFFNLLLIKGYGAIGASIATVMAEFSVVLVQLIFVKSEINIKEAFKLSINYVISSVIMFFVCIIIGGLVNNDILSIMAQVISGVIVYGICLLVLKDKITYTILEKIKGKVKG